jgi:branched-chain amino acid aminotransferase
MLISPTYVRIPTESVDSTAKNFHWMDLRQSLFEAGAMGHEISALCDSQQNLAEAPGSNIFVVKAGKLLTPSRHCLEGMTRQSVLDLAVEIGVPVHVGAVHADVLRTADEAFVTSTAGGIIPITRVDGRSLGVNGTAGEITRRLHNLYWEKRWEGWHATPVGYDAA